MGSTTKGLCGNAGTLAQEMPWAQLQRRRLRARLLLEHVEFRVQVLKLWGVGFAGFRRYRRLSCAVFSWKWVFGD